MPRAAVSSRGKLLVHVSVECNLVLSCVASYSQGLLRCLRRYFISKLLGLSDKVCRTMSIEVGQTL